MPNLLSFLTFNVYSEPRLLPSTGITRLPRYYEPLRHPIAPGLSVTGFRLVFTPRPREGLPVLLRSSSCMHAVATTPTEVQGASFRSLPLELAAFPDFLAGRLPYCVFRGLLSVHCTLRPAYSPSHLMTLYTGGFSRFVTSTTAPIATGWSESCRMGFAPTERPCLSTAHKKSYAKLRLVANVAYPRIATERPPLLSDPRIIRKNVNLRDRLNN